MQQEEASHDSCLRGRGTELIPRVGWWARLHSLSQGSLGQRTQWEEPGSCSVPGCRKEGPSVSPSLLGRQAVFLGLLCVFPKGSWYWPLNPGQVGEEGHPGNS